MTQFTKTASVLAAMALTVPMVCQAAVDPIGSLAQVKQLTAAGKTEDAITLCDKVLTEFSKKNAVSAQFGWVLPFYAWEKGGIYFKAKDYEKAFEAYKAFREDKRWQDPALQAAVKENRKDQPEGIAPMLSNVVFQMGYCRYQQGAGEEEKPNSPAKPGDPTKFDEAITLLEEYLGMLQKGKVSQTEKAQKLDGQICFLLLQANLLKPTPDFQKASQYLDLSRTVKGKVPDEMAMNGLATIINVAMKDPKNVGWVHKIIGASPASYKLEPSRSGRSANKFLNYGIRATRLADTALKDGDMEVAQEAVRSANMLFGLVPDVADVRADITTMSKSLGKYTKPIVDRGTGNKLTKDSFDKLGESYKKIAEDKMNLEAFAILSTANTAIAMGSNRLGKAGYQILFDRYRDLQNKTKDGVKPMKNDNIFQLAQLCYATGDEAAGANFDQMLDGEDMGDRGKNIAFNKLARLVKDQKWEEIEGVAQEVMQSYGSDVTHKCYVLAQFYTLSAFYKMKEYAKVVEAGNALLKGGNLVAGKEKNSLKEEEVTKLSGQSYFFIMDALAKLGATVDTKNYDKALAVFEEYKTAHPSLDLKENALAPNAYYNAVDVLLKQAALATDEAATEKLQERALALLAVITENWKETDLYPNAELLTGSIIINGKDETIKDTAIAALERCTDAALKLKDGKGKATAANALYWLGSYTPEIERAGESEEARMARVKGFAERFWAEADAPGNSFSLQEVSLELSRVSDKESFEKTTQLARDIIAREATYALEHETANPELEKTINTYVDAYVTGNKKYLDKELTLEEKAEHFNNFPGISPEDKYARAIFRMALINSMNTALGALKDNPEAKAALQNDIEKTFREMTNTFKPADLTSFICVNVGDYLVNYVGRFEDPSSKQDEINLAVSYYDAVIERNKEADLVSASVLGKANALAFSKDSTQQKTAEELYNKVVASNDPTVTGPALVGLTKMYMRTGDYASAVKSAAAYIQNRGDKRDKLAVMIMLGEAYAKSGDDKNALLTYMNIYNQNKGNILYSAPACKAMMEIMWKRNNPATGDRLKGNFKASDRWTAWTTGQKYVDLVIKGGIEAKLTPAERDEFNKVKADLAGYAADAAVQKEDKEGKDFQRKLQKK